MKQSWHLTAALGILLVCLFFSVCACAEEIRPLETVSENTDLSNGTFCITIPDDSDPAGTGFFTASLFVEDRYDAAQISALAPGDTVWMNGYAWTVHEVVVHEYEGSVLNTTFEICPEEEYYGYLVFEPCGDGTFRAVIDDWVPVTSVGKIRVALPLPDRFSYIRISSGEEEDPADAQTFLEDLWMFGGFTAWNTACTVENGELVSITHSSYPEGPEACWPEDGDFSPGSSGEMPLWQFCSGDPDLLESAVISAYFIDCEAGPEPCELTDEKMNELRTLAMYGVVTGRENDMMTTGGSTVYVFETSGGEHIMSVEMFSGLIVGSDGMYGFAVR